MAARTSLEAKSEEGLSPRFVKLGLLALTGATLAVWLSSERCWPRFLAALYCFVGNTRCCGLRNRGPADRLSYVAISTTLVWLVHRAGRELLTRFFSGRLAVHR